MLLSSSILPSRKLVIPSFPIPLAFYCRGDWAPTCKHFPLFQYCWASPNEPTGLTYCITLPAPSSSPWGWQLARLLFGHLTFGLITAVRIRVQHLILLGPSLASPPLAQDLSSTGGGLNSILWAPLLADGGCAEEEGDAALEQGWGRAHQLPAANSFSA